MAFYPLFIDLAGKKCLVVGGGEVAFRKVTTLVRANADVTVVADRFSRRFKPLPGKIRLVKRRFRNSDISVSLTLVIGATDSLEVNSAVARRAKKLRILCNIVDNPLLCSFIVPAVVRRGNVSVAVSTGGGSPYLAKYLKERISGLVGPEYKMLGTFLVNVRRKLAVAVPDPSKRMKFWRAFFKDDPAILVRRKGLAGLAKKTSRLLKRSGSKAVDL
jgi:precorrin-2 dehydrogenase/sirohydrochlorin ferrochelatase